MKRYNDKGFTILELLVVVAIIAILAMIAIPNFIGRIEQAKISQDLAEINAVEKAIATYYAEHGQYPTLQGKDGTLLQAQPILGSPHNVDFSTLVPDYLASLPHFSYWWVDYQGHVYHTEKALGSVVGNVFTPAVGYTYTAHKADGSTQVLSGAYTLQVGDFVTGKDALGKDLPTLSSVFKNEKQHPEDPEYVANTKPTAVITMTPNTSITTNTVLTWSTGSSSDPDGDTIAAVEWQGKQTNYATAGTYTVSLRVQDSKGLWSEWVSKEFTVATYVVSGAGVVKDANTTITNVNGVYTLRLNTSGGHTGGSVRLDENLLNHDVVQVEFDMQSSGTYSTAFGVYFGFVSSTTSRDNTYYGNPTTPAILFKSEPHLKSTFVYNNATQATCNQFVPASNVIYRMKVIGDIKNNVMYVYSNDVLLSSTTYGFKSAMPSGVYFVFGKGDYTSSTEVFKNFKITYTN